MRVSPSPLRALHISGSGWWGDISSRAFSHQPPLLSPLAPPPAAAQDSGESSRQEHAGRPPRARGLPSLPPCVGGPPDLQICGTSSRAAGFGFFRPPVAAPGDGVVGEPLPQPRQGRIAACRCEFVRPPSPKVCGHGLVRPSTGLGARAAALWLADAAHTVRRLHADSAAANFGHAEAPRMGVLQMRKRRGTCTCGSSFHSSFFSSIAVAHFELAHSFV